MRGWIGGGLLVLGAALAAGALLSGSQGTIFSLLPAALVIMVVAVVVAWPAWRGVAGRILIVLGVLAVIAGALALAYALILAAGFSGVR